MSQQEDEENKSNVVSISLSAVLQWIPIWLAFIGMFLSAANVYANVMTRLATLETRLNLLTEMLSETRGEVSKMDRQDLRQRQEEQDKEETRRNDKL